MRPGILVGTIVLIGDARMGAENIVWVCIAVGFGEFEFVELLNFNEGKREVGGSDVMF